MASCQFGNETKSHQSYFELQEEPKYDATKTKGAWLNAIAKHELGHVLGLKHEHQRHDRDSFVRVPTQAESDYDSSRYNTNYGKIAQNNYHNPLRIKIVWIPVRAFWGTIYSPIFVFYWPTEFHSVNSYTPYRYDCDSIMQYPGMKILDATCTRSLFSSHTANNYEISPLDADTIKYLY